MCELRNISVKTVEKGVKQEFNGEFEKYSGLPHDLTNKIEKLNSYALGFL